MKKWHEAEGTGTVCQVDRGGCEIILCQDASRNDRARLFIELTRDGIDGLRREVAAREVPATRAWWGYDVSGYWTPTATSCCSPLDGINDRERSR